MKSLKQSIVSTHTYEIDTFNKKISKAFEDSVSRIKTCEVYVKDKVRDVKEDVKMMERNLSKFATREMTDKLAETEKSNK